MSGPLLVLCTTGSADEAAAIARTLVEERLAACVQISTIESWYRWQGAIEHAPEQRLHIKTDVARWPAVEARIRELHSYELPEIVALPIGGSADYIAWIGEQLAG